jgi:hypothetical protein
MAEVKTADASTNIEDRDKTLVKLARRVRSGQKKVVVAVLQIGSDLSEAKTLLATDSGASYTKWLKTTGISRQSARNFVLAYQAFEGVCTTVVHRLTARAVYRLAGPQVPQQAVEAACHIADCGDPVNDSIAKLLISELQPPRPTGTLPAPIVVRTEVAVISIRPLKPGVDAKTALAMALRQLVEPERRAA